MHPGRPLPPLVRARQALTALALAACSSAFAQAPAAAPAAAPPPNDYVTIAQMLRTGRAAEALARADQLLVNRPRDPQLQFLRAQALAGGGRAPEAIEAYLQITREYPELAEPHNNLAVLYADQNQLESARAALEAALRANPAYATAHENLGDILVRLAVQSWNRARQLEPGLPGVGPKLAAARSLIDATTPATRARAPASAPPAAPGAPAPR